MIRVFLSYATPDRPMAREVARVLLDAGMEVWLGDENDFFPGDNWAEVVATKLRNSDAMVVLLTQHSLASQHVNQEISYALSQQSYRWRLIPVLIETLPYEEVPWILRHLQVVTAVGPDFARGIGEVVSRLRQPARPAPLAIQRVSA